MTMNEFLTQLSVALIPVIATALTALIGVGVAYLSGLVKQKFGEAAQDKADMYLSMMQDVATAAVVEVQQKTVDRLKKSGKWDEDTAEEVKEEAVEIALASLGNLRGEIQRQLLIDVPEYMARLIEVALRGLKAATPPQA